MGIKKYFVYALRRIVFIIITMWVVATFTFLLMHLLPGNSFTTSKVIPPMILENLNVKYGLDKPLIEQYTVYMGNLIKGDLGISMVYKNKSVNSIIKRTFPVSLDLGIRAGFVALFVGLFLGMLSSFFKDKVIDHFTLVIIMIGVSIPGFILAALFQYVICYKLSDILQFLTGSQYRVFPITGWGSLRHTVVPSLTLALGAMGMIARMMRSSMIEVLNENYIIAARAKGLSERKILFKHAFKNAIIPVVSILGPLMTSIIMGSFIIENFFSIPGLGQYFVSSIQAKDYTMILGLSLFTVLVVVLLNTVTDILYVILNPRVNISEEERGRGL